MRGELISDIEFPQSIKSINEVKIKSINEFTAIIVRSYLQYASEIVSSALNKQGYSTTFRDINDELVIKPFELIDLINSVQRALVSAND